MDVHEAVERIRAGEDPESVAEEVSGNGEAYEKFFKGKLRDYGVASPAELSKPDKRKFFSEIKAEWKAEKRKK